jgi:hypothetical protein
MKLTPSNDALVTSLSRAEKYLDQVGAKLDAQEARVEESRARHGQVYDVTQSLEKAAKALNKLSPTGDPALAASRAQIADQVQAALSAFKQLPPPPEMKDRAPTMYESKTIESARQVVEVLLRGLPEGHSLGGGIRILPNEHRQSYGVIELAKKYLEKTRPGLLDPSLEDHRLLTETLVPAKSRAADQAILEGFADRLKTFAKFVNGTYNAFARDEATVREAIPGIVPFLSKFLGDFGDLRFSQFLAKVADRLEAKDTALSHELLDNSAVAAPARLPADVAARGLAVAADLRQLAALVREAPKGSGHEPAEVFRAIDDFASTWGYGIGYYFREMNSVLRAKHAAVSFVVSTLQPLREKA